MGHEQDVRGELKGGRKQGLSGKRLFIVELDPAKTRRLYGVQDVMVGQQQVRGDQKPGSPTDTPACVADMDAPNGAANLRAARQEPTRLRILPADLRFKGALRLLRGLADRATRQSVPILLPQNGRQALIRQHPHLPLLNAVRTIRF